MEISATPVNENERTVEFIPWQMRFGKTYAPPYRIVFFGTANIALPALRLCLEERRIETMAVVSQPDRPAGRGQRQHTADIVLAARSANVPVFQPEKLSELRDSISAMAPDLFVVMAFGKILPIWLLAIPKIAPLNLHASLLPRHRGAAPIQAAIVSGDSHSGVTLMGMETAMDAGPILLQQKIALEHNETAGSLHDRIASLAAQCLRAGLDALESGSLAVKAQNHEQATYAPKLTAETAKINWAASAHEVDRHVRAMSPKPGAYFEWQMRRFKILEGGVGDDAGLDLAAVGPGRVAFVSRDSLIVGTAMGGYAIRQIQPAGKKVMAIDEFLRGTSIPAGDLFT